MQWINLIPLFQKLNIIIQLFLLTLSDFKVSVLRDKSVVR